jgi:hypothetical protein
MATLGHREYLCFVLEKVLRYGFGGLPPGREVILVNRGSEAAMIDKNASVNLS